MTTILIIIITTTLGVFQSALLLDIMPMGIVPDLALVLLLVASCHYGSMTGVIAGFFTGLSHDLLGIAPLGFHAALYTLIGYTGGLLRSKVSPGRFIMPMLVTFSATVLKYGGAYLLNLALNQKIEYFFLWKGIIETGLNTFLSPIVFYGFLLIARTINRRRGGFR